MDDLDKMKPLKKKIDWPEFPIGTAVYGLFPETTCFYLAMVVIPPSSYGKNKYKLSFQEDTAKSRDVDVRFVTSFDVLF